MKNDKYLKIILTIIAICLVWICIKDYLINYDVRIVETTRRSFYRAEPIEVDIAYIPEPIQVEIVNH